MPSLTVMRASLSLRSPNYYNPFAILSTGGGITGAQAIHGVKSVTSVFIMDDLHLFAACDWFDLPSFTSEISRKSVPPPPLWFSHDASMLFSDYHHDPIEMLRGGSPHLTGSSFSTPREMIRTSLSLSVILCLSYFFEFNCFLLCGV